MSAAERKEAIVKLSGNLKKSTSLFRKQTFEADKVTHATYAVSRLLACRMKPFVDGDFIKECIMVEYIPFVLKTVLLLKAETFTLHCLSLH